MRKLIALILTSILSPPSISAPNSYENSFDLFIGTNLKHEDALHISYDIAGNHYFITQLYNNPQASTTPTETSTDNQQHEESNSLLFSQPTSSSLDTVTDWEKSETEAATINPSHVNANTDAYHTPSSSNQNSDNQDSITGVHNWSHIFTDAITRASNHGTVFTGTLDRLRDSFLLLRSDPLFNFILNAPEPVTSSGANMDTEDAQDSQRVTFHYAATTAGIIADEMRRTGLQDYIKVSYKSSTHQNRYSITILLRYDSDTKEYQVHAVFMRSNEEKISLRTKQFREDYTGAKGSGRYIPKDVSSSTGAGTSTSEPKNQKKPSSSVAQLAMAIGLYFLSAQANNKHP